MSIVPATHYLNGTLRALHASEVTEMELSEYDLSVVPVFVWRPAVEGTGFRYGESDHAHETIYTSVRWDSHGIVLLDDPPGQPLDQTIKMLLSSGLLPQLLRGFLYTHDTTVIPTNIPITIDQVNRYYVYLAVSDCGRAHIDWGVGDCLETFRLTAKEVRSYDNPQYYNPSDVPRLPDSASLWRNAAVIVGLPNETISRAIKREWRISTMEMREKLLDEETLEKVLRQGRILAHKQRTVGAEFKLLATPDSSGDPLLLM